MTEIIINNVKGFLLKKGKSELTLKQKERKKIISDLKLLEIVWGKYNLERVYLYGSFADMTFHKYSDVDIAVEPEVGFEDQLKLYSEINKYIKREVDVRLLKELPFPDKVKRKGVVVYDRKSIHSEEIDKKRSSKVK